MQFTIIHRTSDCFESKTVFFSKYKYSVPEKKKRGKKITTETYSYLNGEYKYYFRI